MSVGLLSGLLGSLIVGALGSILAVIVLNRVDAFRRIFGTWLGLRLQLASTLAKGGFSRMTLSRADYHRVRQGTGTLREYLGTAKRSIEIISISMNVTQAEGSLISLFEQRLSERENFVVKISLLNPASTVVPLLAKSLDLTADRLRVEIEDTLHQLLGSRQNLPHDALKRFHIMVHDTLPLGSAILLDATPDSGRIQLETKLYRAPRTESFGFELVGPSEFFNRSYTAWQRVFRDSYEWKSGSAATWPIQKMILFDEEK